MTDAALLELRRLTAVVEAQGEQMADLQRQLLAKQDRRTGQRLLPAIGRLMGDGAFAVAELASKALNDRTPAGATVRDALADHADSDQGFRGFGRLLQRLAGVPLAGYRVQRAGAESWCVQAGYSTK